VDVDFPDGARMEGISLDAMGKYLFLSSSKYKPGKFAGMIRLEGGKVRRCKGGCLFCPPPGSLMRSRINDLWKRWTTAQSQGRNTSTTVPIEIATGTMVELERH